MNEVTLAWNMIERLGALIATEGVSEEVKKACNKEIEKLISSVISPNVTKITASSSGIVI